MFVKAALVSLLLLLASRVLGVLRESALAAAFGSTALADLAVLLLTLPDWLASVLAGGALAWVLLPAWAQQPEQQRNRMQARVARRLLALALALAAAICAAQAPLAALLLPGAPPALARLALVWSALALPAALLAGLWATRLQHERDFAGLYGANLVVNGVLIGALVLLGGYGAAGAADGADSAAVSWLGAAVLAALLLRLLWQRWRLRALLPWRWRRRWQAPEQPAGNGWPAPGAGAPPSVALPQAPGPESAAQPSAASAVVSVPGWRVWLWAGLAAGLPLLLPFAARTLAAGAGAGALANFNYAWKLVELPLVLAIQLVAALAFPAIAQAHAQALAAGGTGDAGAQALTQAVRGALVLAWTLACAAAAALQAGAPALAALLFGWGRMQAPALAQIAAWGSAGAWGLLPQALLAVALTLLASQRRMRAAVFAYTLALAPLLVAAAARASAGAQLMWALNAAFLLAALLAWGALGAAALRRWIVPRTLAPPLLALLAVAALVHWSGAAPGAELPSPPAAGAAALAAPGAALRAIGAQQLAGLARCALAAAAVLACGWFCGPHLRRALRG